MTRDQIPKLRYFEGRRVSLALADGSRIDDCELVSAGRRGVETLWVFTNGRDAFLSLEDVIDLWEAPPLSGSRATWGLGQLIGPDEWLSPLAPPAPEPGPARDTSYAA